MEIVRKPYPADTCGYSAQAVMARSSHAASKSHRFLLTLALTWLLSSDAGAAIISDFSWIGPAPGVTASTLLSNGAEVTLHVAGSIPFRPDAAEPNAALLLSVDNPSPIRIFLRFSQPWYSLRLHIADLDASVPEQLVLFGPILPTAVDGDLELIQGGTVVNPVVEQGEGNLFWSGLSDPLAEITFVYTRCAGCGLYLTEFEVDFDAPVPLPAGAWLLGAGLPLTLVAGRRRRGNLA